LVALLWILEFKLGVRFSYMGKRRVNIIPFSEPVILNGKIDFGEMILNAVIFVPLGIYAAIIFEKLDLWKKKFSYFS
jgi:glycopeptide antibiotics resistance protein